MARAASGALDMVPFAYVSNIAQAMDTLKESGYWCIGLDGQAYDALQEFALPDKVALVLGAEGKGLRELTIKRCDGLVKLSMHPQMESLNVSNAAAIALHTLYTRSG